MLKIVYTVHWIQLNKLSTVSKKYKYFDFVLELKLKRKRNEAPPVGGSKWFAHLPIRGGGGGGHGICC